MTRGERTGVWRRLAVLLPPYLWLAVFFALPIAVVLAISLSRPVTGIPPYAPLLKWTGPRFNGDLEN